MLAAYPNPHPPACPWHASVDLLGAPNIKWCETTLCGWVSEPANTWSNLLYLVFAVMVLRQCRRSAHVELRWMGPFMLVMGLLSAAYHASNNYLSQLLDFAGMYLLVFWFLAINLRRNGWMPARALRPVHATLVVLGLGLVHLMYLRHWPFQWLIALASAGIVATEFSARRQPVEQVPLGYFGAGLLTLGMAQAASLADLSRALCDPDNHWVQGHAVWHLVSALALYLSCQHYRLLHPEPGALKPATP